MTGFVIDPVKQTIEKIDLPDRNDRVLRGIIADLLHCTFFSLQVEFANRDVILV
jgi:hypothetical protein